MYKLISIKNLILILIIINIGLLTACNSTHQNYVEQDLNKGEINSSDILNGVIKNGWVFYSGDINNTNLYKIRTDGKDKKLLKRTRAEVIDVIDDWIYYNDLNKSAIYKIKTNGKNNKMIFGGKRLKGYCARGFKIIDDWIYFTDWYGSYEIYRVKLDGSNTELISPGTYGRIFESNGWIYYIDSKTRNLSRVKFDGTNVEKLNISNTRDFCINGEIVYYCNSSSEGDGKAYKISIDGNGKELLIDDIVDEICYLDGWLVFSSGSVYKVEIGKKDFEKILPGAGHIEVHGKWIYFWSENEHNPIMGRAGINGKAN